MSEARKRLVMDVFIRLDKTGDGVITVDDILDSYNVRSHPKYQNGEMSKKEILTQFLTNFEVGDHVDGTVSIRVNVSVIVCACVGDEGWFVPSSN